MSSLSIRHWSGDPERQALALHCMMGTASYWKPIAAALDGRIDLRAPDLPGHGRSPHWQPGELDYHTAATRQIAELIDRPLDLIGHSLGATIALRIAVAAPEAVRTLTLIEPVLFAAAQDDEQDALFARMDAALAANDRAKATRAFLEVWGLPKDGATHAARTPAPIFPETLIEQIGMVVETNDVLVHDKARILREGGLEAIDAPVLFITGEKSPAAIGKIADALAARMQDVGRAVVPGAGHMLPITHPHEVAGLIGVNLDRG